MSWMSLKSVMLSLLLSQAIFLCGLPFFLQLLLYLNPLVIMVVWFCILLFVSFAVFYFRGETVMIPRRLWQTVLFGYSLSLLVLLFFRPKGQVYSYNLIPFSTILTYLSNEMNGLVSFYNLIAMWGYLFHSGCICCPGRGKSPPL